MGIHYDPAKEPEKRWVVSYEKTDYTPAQLKLKLYQDELAANEFRNKAYDTLLSLAATTQGGDYVDRREVIRKLFDVTLLPTDLPTNLKTDYPTNVKIQQGKKLVLDKQTNTKNAELNKTNAAINKKNAATNTANKAKNDDTLKAAPKATLLPVLEQEFKTFYQTEKLKPWDPALGAKPLYGDFDPDYYKVQNPTVAKQWEDAVANDDLDITERYGEEGFYAQHYTTQGKAAGLRGNAPEETDAADVYVETKPTDVDLQNARNLQLSVDTKTQTDRLLKIPEIAQEWEKAKGQDPYWKQLAKANYLSVDDPTEFVTLFRLSNRDQDKQVRLDYNVNAGYGISELEDAVNSAVGTKAMADVKKFGNFAQDTLKATIEEMKKAKSKESMMQLMGSFGGFSEIANINKELANSILGDSGVGGVMAFTAKGNPQEALENSLKKITGVNNNVAYNWQQWFDTQLKTRYAQEIEAGLDKSEAEAKLTQEGQFARDFIEKYLTPRFNASRSMDEFVEYLDVQPEEGNPFQTQDMVNAVSLVASLRAKQYLDQIKATDERYFDPEFYFNPTGDLSRETQYKDQTETVTKDWEDAKAGDPYWQQQAYRFGVDINDKAAFARMHFQVKGQGKGYDAADDILNATKVTDEIYKNILPALEKEALKQGTVFGQFIKPEEFADEILKGVDPGDPEKWNDVLQRYGLTEFKGTVDELKQYITENLRTSSGQQIRDEIKRLNEQKQTPTQEKLGITYIQRPEDAATTTAAADTELYKVFQSAGYKGTEDEFYSTMFPDIDRTEQKLLTKAGAGSGLELKDLNLKDPFASLNTLQGLFGEDTTDSFGKDSTSLLSDYLKMGVDSTKDEDYKSSAGEKFLGEFTSMFKGF